jgi:predicted small secreted protein
MAGVREDLQRTADTVQVAGFGHDVQASSVCYPLVPPSFSAATLTLVSLD